MALVKLKDVEVAPRMVESGPFKVQLSVGRRV